MTVKSISDPFDRVGYLFGYPISHSMSPILHNIIYEGLGLNWQQFYLESTDMQHFLELTKDPKFYGASITMPHKLSILPHLDDLTPEGRDVGACNTIFLRHDPTTGARQLVGTNTDLVGIRDAFYHNIPAPDAVFHNRPGLVIGGGGAARSAVYALQRLMRARPIYLVNRDAAEVAAVMAECAAKGFGEALVHVATPEQAAALEGPGAVVACVPDFPPVTAAEKTARAVVECLLAKEHKGAMLEMCYHPSPWTELGALAERAGWKVILGTEAMIYQGFEQDKLWTGRSVEEMPVQRAKDAIAARLASKSKPKM